FTGWQGQDLDVLWIAGPLVGVLAASGQTQCVTALLCATLHGEVIDHARGGRVGPRRLDHAEHEGHPLDAGWGLETTRVPHGLPVVGEVGHRALEGRTC